MRHFKELLKSSVVRYLGVGGTAFLVDFGATVLARDVLLFPLWLAVFLGLSGGFITNFTLQRNFSFQSDRPYSWSFTLYILLVAFNWVATTIGMYLLVEHLGYPTAVGKLICTVVTTLWNYPLYRYIVFPPSKTKVKLSPPAPLPKKIDYVIPAHNSADVLEETVKELTAWSNANEIMIHAIIVENGSKDATPEIAAKLANSQHGAFIKITATSSEKGLGKAYRHGISLSSADLVVLSADDLPFGTTDIDAWLASPTYGLCIGSKAHPDSIVERGIVRAVSSFGFRFLRSMILHSKVGDPQGTLLVNGNWLRAVNKHCQENGYLSSTEIVAIAENYPIEIKELPVCLTPRQAQHHTRISISDVKEMGIGLLRIRQNSKIAIVEVQQALNHS